MRARMISTACALLALSATGASAQQIGPTLVSCDVADFNMVLRMELPLSPDGTGSPGPKGMRGTLEIHHQKVPKDRRLWSLDGKPPAQFWNVEPELKMLLVFGGVGDQIRLVIDLKRQQGHSEHNG
ncbi:MAG: hypothetical protein JSS20_14500, partial [Proteobacteria bacterium]|nr:hypothetical protein [Pseudomonadota bacterium]